MLTVIREMAEEAELPDVRALPAAEALARVVARGEDAVERTPEMLDKLREAGVVDAGGAGLVELVRGVLHELTGEPLPEVPDVTEEITEESIHHEESEYRYCTVFVVEGQALDLDALHGRLEPLGDSLLVTGDESVAKVHVHTDEPERALDIGRAVGLVDGGRVEIGDMQSQAAERERWLAQLHAAAQAPPAGVALVAVAQGPGNRDILRSEGAGIVIEGGQTMNPSVGQILEAITAVNADHVIVLPNNPNVRLAAENAAGESTKDVRVIATGLAARGDRGRVRVRCREGHRRERGRRCAEALSAVLAAEITIASRNATVDGVTAAEGDYLAMLDGKAVAAGDDLWVVLDAVLDRFSSEGRSYVHALLRRGRARGRRDQGPRRGARARRRRARGAASLTTRSSSRRSEPWRHASCSSRTTTSTAPRSSSCSACSRTSRSSAPWAPATRRPGRRADLAPDVVADGLPPARASTAPPRRAR